MENEKMKMVMMNEELFKKYAEATRDIVINKMKEKCKQWTSIIEFSEFATMTIFMHEFKHLLFDSDECEEGE